MKTLLLLIAAPVVVGDSVAVGRAASARVFHLLHLPAYVPARAPRDSTSAARDPRQRLTRRIIGTEGAVAALIPDTTSTEIPTIIVRLAVETRFAHGWTLLGQFQPCGPPRSRRATRSHL